MAWHTSTRAQRLPNNWQHLRKHVHKRAQGKCQAQQHAPGCTGQGTQVDHITPGDYHHPTNLQLLSKQCHDAKTRAENAEANRARAAMRRRPEEQHPGLKQNQN